MPDTTLSEMREKWAKGCGSREEFDAIVEIVTFLTAPKSAPEPEHAHTGPKAKAKHK